MRVGEGLLRQSTTAPLDSPEASPSQSRRLRLRCTLCQPVGHRPENPDIMYNSGRDVWSSALRARQPEITAESIEAYLHNLYRVRPDFVYSVAREFVRSCQTPLLVMPDDTPAHPYQTSVDIAALAPKAQSTVFPWREPKDLLEKTIDQVRAFLRSHQPVTQGR